MGLVHGMFILQVDVRDIPLYILLYLIVTYSEDKSMSHKTSANLQVN